MALRWETVLSWWMWLADGFITLSKTFQTLMCNRAPLSLCCCSEPCSHYKHDGPSVEHLSSLHFSGPTASLSLSTFICHYDTRRLQGKHCGWYRLMLGLVCWTAAPESDCKKLTETWQHYFPQKHLLPWVFVGQDTFRIMIASVQMEEKNYDIRWRGPETYLTVSPVVPHQNVI